MDFFIICLFFIVALAYSTIGFGGGSSYIALMVLFQIPYHHIPVIALVCNLIVVSGSLFYYQKHINSSIRKVIPLIFTSVPAAYFAGSIHVSKDLFLVILGFCLLISSIRMLIRPKKLSYESLAVKLPHPFIASIVGIVLGFISGIVGIGGGIFLSPVMHNLRWGKPKEIAAICCLFIFFNSTSGLLGQLQKEVSLSVLGSYWPLFVAVSIGGIIGSYLGATKIKPKHIQLLTSLLILFVSLRILFVTN
jgi:uncharacterized membrane protein YfcA